ncbi:hypothetical protein ACWD01_03010 [Streptomyces sp. NPDC002835]
MEQGPALPQRCRRGCPQAPYPASRSHDQDYPRGTTHQPDEPPLEMTPDHLRRLRDALARRQGPSGDFIVVYED